MLLLLGVSAGAVGDISTSAKHPAKDASRRELTAQPAGTKFRYNLPVLAVRNRVSGGMKGSCQFLPFTVETTGGQEPLRISFSDNTPNGSGATIRNSLWTAALTAGLQKNSALQGVRVSMDFKGGIDGPSAGAVMCLGIMSALDGREFPGDFAMTGTILPDGTIGLVGGVPEKLEAAAKNPKIKRVAIPAFQRFAKNAKDEWVDLFEYGTSLGLKLRPVESIGDAYRFLHGETPEPRVSVSPLAVCREASEFEAQAAEVFKKREDALRARLQSMEPDELKSLKDSWEWAEINPTHAARRFEEGAIFDALNLISREDANLTAYKESWNFYRDFLEVFLRGADEKKGLFQKSLREQSLHEWPVEQRLALIDGFRARIRVLCKQGLGWASDEEDSDSEGDESERTDQSADEIWAGLIPDAGASDLDAQLLSLLEASRPEGTYRFMEKQTFDREALEEALRTGNRSVYDEIEYDRKKLFFLMCEQSRRPSFTDVPLPKRNVGPHAEATMTLFRNAWTIVDRSIESDVVSALAAQTAIHENQIRDYLIGENVEYSVYTTAKIYGKLVLNLLDETKQEGGELKFEGWTRACCLFNLAELFSEASALLTELDGETENASFTAYITDRARTTALQSMADCREAGIPCFGAVLDFQKAERARTSSEASASSVLADYWKATMTAKALVMAFRGGVGPEQGFHGYPESEKIRDTKAAASALLGLLLNAETEPFLASLPPSWVTSVSEAAAIIAAKIDDESWNSVQGILHQAGVLLVRKAPLFVEWTFANKNDLPDIPLSQEELRSLFKNWGHRLLGIARAATRDAIAAGRLPEALRAPKEFLDGKPERGLTLTIPEIVARRSNDETVEVSIPSLNIFGEEEASFCDLEGKMVHAGWLDLFKNCTSWKKYTDEVLSGTKAKDLRIDLSVILSMASAILDKIAHAESLEELDEIVGKVNLNFFP